MRPLWLALVPLIILPIAAHADTAPPSPPATTLYMAGDYGVREIGLDGHVVRTLTKVPSRWPRRLDDQDLVVVRPATGEVVAVALADGKERVIAHLPESAKVCKTDDSEEHLWPLKELGVQSNGDFVVDGAGANLCLSLKDRNLNMLDVDVGLRVDVKTGAVTSTINYPLCAGAATLPTCQVSAGGEAINPWGGNFDIVGGWLVHRDVWRKKPPKKVVQLGKDFNAELASPKGDWTVISGNIDGEDYVHRSLYLLDRATGAVWTIDPKPQSIPKNKLKNLKVATIDAVGETSMRWLADGPLLLVDSTLVAPGKGTIDLGPGDVLP